MVPGASETIFLGDAWQSYVASAYQRALKACNLEYENCILEAGEEWQKIFGIAISQLFDGRETTAPYNGV